MATAGAHIVVAWALWTLTRAPHEPPRVQPLWVALLKAEAPQPQPEQPQPQPRSQPMQAPPSLASPMPVPVPLQRSDAVTPLAPALVAAIPAVVAPLEPAAPVAVPPPPPRLLRADQVRYLVTPPAEVPLLSRRAGESGVVWLRVRIDTQGRPARIALHRSSGFRRLDEQALAAMAQARFAPALEDGVAVEVEVIAPIEYAAD